MSDLRDRFRSLDKLSAPDLWSEAVGRATEGEDRLALGASRNRRWGMSPVMVALLTLLLLAGLVAGAAIAGGWLSDEPLVVVESPTPTSEGPTVDAGVIAYTADSGLSLLVLVRPGDEPQQLAPGDLIANDVACPAFSPDGSLLAVGMPGGSIVVLSIEEGRATGEGARLDAGLSETPHCPTWSPDSSAVALLDDSDVVILPLVGQAQRIGGWDLENIPQSAFDASYPSDRAVQWSPDVSVIAVARASGTWLIPVDGGAPVRLHDTPAFSVSWSPDATRLVVGSREPGAIVIRVADGATLAELPSRFTPPVWSLWTTGLPSPTRRPD
ncbi:MAG: WD40 repeat domain-containing protein [Chloroflexota bacterium]|nr:WD40 repeat domain-containing protein [Chloroflexota bacterium]